MKIGIVGLGFVGTAVLTAYESCGVDIEYVLRDPDKGYNATYEELYACDGIFVCVPSPQASDGSCDTSILEYVLSNLQNYIGVIISKTTAPPNVYKRLSKQYANLVHAPEFLTAANANVDYLESTFVIVGASYNIFAREAARIIALPLTKMSKQIFCTTEEASLAKYAINTFLATKVIFMNELNKLASQSGIDYNVISSIIKRDNRIGISHMQVPGPDGEYGFGGACFPKDTSALLYYARSIGVDMKLLETAVEENKNLR